MSREIKFRAWDITDKKMLYKIDTWHVHTGKVEVEGDNWDWYKKSRDIMQYTGLLDRNGKEIYEGDVIDGSWINPMSGEKVTRYYVVAFNKGKYDAELIGRHPYGSKSLYFANGESVVIGNIYEHPHLLEARSAIGTNESAQGAQATGGRINV